MAKRMAKVVAATVCSLAVIGGTASTAAAEKRPMVAVRIQNLPDVPEWLAEGARRQATRIYAAAGVDLLWTEDDGDGRARRVTVTMVTGRRADPMLPPRVLGRAFRGANLTYVHVGRVVALARRRGVTPGTLLGNVIAHELGHILLPTAGHSGRGIMTETLNLLTTSAVGFTPEQAVAIRATLENQPDAVVARLE